MEAPGAVLDPHPGRAAERWAAADPHLVRELIPAAKPCLEGCTRDAGRHSGRAPSACGAVYARGGKGREHTTTMRRIGSQRKKSEPVDGVPPEAVAMDLRLGSLYPAHLAREVVRSAFQSPRQGLGYLCHKYYRWRHSAQTPPPKSAFQNPWQGLGFLCHKNPLPSAGFVLLASHGELSLGSALRLRPNSSRSAPGSGRTSRYRP